MVSLGSSCEVFGILGKSLKKTKMNKAVNISAGVTAMPLDKLSVIFTA